MYDIRDGAYYFILIDFDMAIVVENRKGKSTYHASSKHRTGTLPFMAWELVRDAARGMDNPDLVPISHLLRHDYESLFYVSFWSITAIPCPDNPKHRAVLAKAAKKLEGSSLEDLASAKRGFLTDPIEVAVRDASSAGQGLSKWFLRFSKIFHQAVTALVDYEYVLREAEDEDSTAHSAFDMETLNGLVNKDHLKAELTSCIPAKSFLAMKVILKTSKPAASSGVASTVIDGKQPEQPETKAGIAGLKSPIHAQDDLRTRRRNSRKTRMTVEQAMAAAEYRDTRLRARKPRVYY